MTNGIDEEYLEALATYASQSLQEIQDLLGTTKNSRGKVRFPRGYLRTAAQQRSLLPYVGTPLQIHNASYSLMMADVLRWLAIRTDISGSALSMIVKETICIYGAICDWMTKEATRGHGSRRSFTYRTNRLVELGLIEEGLKDELDWVWEVRCNEHFHEVDGLEHDRYTRADHDRARKAFASLASSIKIAMNDGG